MLYWNEKLYLYPFYPYHWYRFYFCHFQCPHLYLYPNRKNQNPFLHLLLLLVIVHFLNFDDLRTDFDILIDCFHLCCCLIIKHNNRRLHKSFFLYIYTHKHPRTHTHTHTHTHMPYHTHNRIYLFFFNNTT